MPSEGTVGNTDPVVMSRIQGLTICILILPPTLENYPFGRVLFNLSNEVFLFVKNSGFVLLC